MPQIGKKSFPYDKEGMAAFKKAKKTAAKKAMPKKMGKKK
jgi:hypothetical protein